MVHAIKYKIHVSITTVQLRDLLELLLCGPLDGSLGDVEMPGSVGLSSSSSAAKPSPTSTSTSASASNGAATLVFGPTKHVAGPLDLATIYLNKVSDVCMSL